MPRNVLRTSESTEHARGALPNSEPACGGHGRQTIYKCY